MDGISYFSRIGIVIVMHNFVHSIHGVSDQNDNDDGDAGDDSGNDNGMIWPDDSDDNDNDDDHTKDEMMKRHDEQFSIFERECGGDDSRGDDGR